MTIIAGPNATGLMDDAVGRLLASAPQIGDVDWLAPGRACDVPITAATAVRAERLAREAIGAAPIDVIVQPAEGRKKRILIADMESTIIENEMLDELADFIGRREHVADITRRAMNGELDFAAALRERVALLRGLPATVLDEAFGRIRLMPGARALIATLRRAGVVTAMVSGGFTVFADRVGSRLGFDRVRANHLEVAGGRILGSVRDPIATRETKRETLIALATEFDVPLSATLAVGDGANDLPMVMAAGLGVAFRGKPTVAAAARHKLDHADLTGLLYAQGYRAAEIVQA